MTVEDVLAKVDGIKQRGDCYSARCPAHDDNHASLSIRLGHNGQALLKCFAGCSYEALIAALGGDKRSDAPREKWTEIPGSVRNTYYDYRDERGDMLYQSVRKQYRERSENGKERDAKTFYQRTPLHAGGKDASSRGREGGVCYNLTGVRRVPFRLPELIQAIAAKKRVVFAEGEKDVLNLVKAGAAATTTAQGANSFLPEYDYPSHFAGAEVVILPDNDVAGKQFAQTVAASLTGIAASVKVLDLPDLPQKGDVSDWLEAGGTLEALNALADDAPEWQFSGEGGVASLSDCTEGELVKEILSRAERALRRKREEWLRSQGLPLAIPVEKGNLSAFVNLGGGLTFQQSATLCAERRADAPQSGETSGHQRLFHARVTWGGREASRIFSVSFPPLIAGEEGL